MWDDDYEEGSLIMQPSKAAVRIMSCHVDAWAGLKICVCVCTTDMLCTAWPTCAKLGRLSSCCTSRLPVLFSAYAFFIQTMLWESCVHCTQYIGEPGLTPTLEQTFHGCKFYLYRLGLSLTIALAAMVLGKRPNMRKMLAAGMPRVLVLVLFLLAYHRADQRAAWLQHRVELSIDRTIQLVSCDFLLTSQGGCADGRKACASHGNLCWGPGAKILKSCAMCCFMLMAPHMLDASCFVLSGSGF